MSMERASEDVQFDAGEFVRRIMADGSKIRCDDTNEAYNNNFKLPSYYDEEKFKRGQKFFHDHIFAMFYAKMVALITGLFTSVAYDILKFTNKSSDPVSAYKRYVSTIFHMYTWYNADMTRDSKVWQSLSQVRRYHNLASNDCSSAGVGEITQAQMALTQAGFMGYAVIRPENIGIFNPNREDLEGFVHLWRVIGYVMGIEERFNICRESLCETKDVCEEIIQQIVKPEVSRRDPAYLDMAEAFVEGMSALLPVLGMKVMTRLVVEMLHQENMHNMKLNLAQRMVYYLILTSLYLLRFRPVRIAQKYHMYLILYVMRTYPALAYYKFGKANTYVPKCN